MRPSSGISLWSRRRWFARCRWACHWVLCILIGPSGCRKSTILKMINRLVDPSFLPDIGARYPNRLPGSQRQRVARARATWPQELPQELTQSLPFFIPVLPQLTGARPWGNVCPICVGPMLADRTGYAPKLHRKGSWRISPNCENLPGTPAKAARYSGVHSARVIKGDCDDDHKNRKTSTSWCGSGFAYQSRDCKGSGQVNDRQAR